MHIHELHSWDVDYSKALAIQNELSNRVTIQNFDQTPRLIAGADVGYSHSDDTLYAAVVIFKFPNLEEVETATATGMADFPYIPGMLTFREAPVLLTAFRKLKRTPEVVMFDGQGIAHPKRLGLASHIGLWLKIPSIGCAKKRLMGEHVKVGPEMGDRTELWSKDKLIGYVVRTRKDVKPVYVSPGHLIDFDMSIDLVLQTTRGYRLPEPTRQAHFAVNELRRNDQLNHV